MFTYYNMATYDLNSTAVEEGIAKFKGKRPMLLYQGGAHLQKYGSVDEGLFRRAFEKCTKGILKHQVCNWQDDSLLPV